MVQYLKHGKLGAILSEKGISYMWYINSRETPLTPWYNNPVTDKCGFRLMINDLTYNTALTNIGYADENSGRWTVRHGIGILYIIERRQRNNDYNCIYR